MKFQKNRQIHMLRLALFISCGGTTMSAIIKACKSGKLKKVLPVLVIASNKDAGGIEKAKRLGISINDIVVINPKEYKRREDFGKAILKECKKRRVNFIGQYGFMTLTPRNVIKKYKGHIVNQHPGPLDTGRSDFGGKGMFGLRVHKTRLEFIRRVKRDYFTEATCHMVTEEFDTGEIVKRKKLIITPKDTTRALQKKLLPIEHEVQVEALRDFSEGIVKIYKRKNPLIRNEEEEKVLEKCKLIAKRAYPNG